MNQDEILEALRDCGLEDKEARVYLTLLLEGKAKASDIAKRAHISRMDAYNSLKKLQNKGIVEATMDKPMHFVPQPVDKALNLFIEVKKGEIQQIEANQQKLSQFLKLTKVEETREYRFRVLKERKHIRAQLFKMVEEATSELLLVTTGEGVVRLKAAGLFELLRARQEEGLTVRMLTEVTPDNTRQVREVMAGLQIRHYPLPNYHLLVCDRQAVLHSVSMDERRGSSGTEDIALWMNSPDFIAAQSTFFDNLWRQAISVEARLEEMKSGRIVQPIRFYLGEGSMYDRLRTLLKERAQGEDGRAKTEEAPYSLADFGIDPTEMMHAIGNRIGHEIAHQLTATTKDELWEQIAQLWSELGLGKMRIDREKGLTIEVSEPFTCRESPQLGHCLCALDEGIIEGILEAKLGLFCSVSEKLCVATGHDTCRYEVRAPTTTAETQRAENAEVLPLVKG